MTPEECLASTTTDTEFLKWFSGGEAEIMLGLSIASWQVHFLTLHQMTVSPCIEMVTGQTTLQKTSYGSLDGLLSSGHVRGVNPSHVIIDEFGPFDPELFMRTPSSVPKRSEVSRTWFSLQRKVFGRRLI